MTTPSGKATYSSGVAKAHRYTRWVVESFQGHYGRMLAEVGIGHGGYHAFLPQGIGYVGLDLDADSVAQARSMHPQAEFMHGDIRNPAVIEALRQRGVDTLLCVNVLEHIENDTLAVRGMLDVLPTGGRLLLFVPAFMSLFGEMDRLAGHHRRYVKADIPRLLAGAPGDAVEISYFNGIGGLGWWLNRRARRESLDDDALNRQIALFDKYILPVSRALDHVTRHVFGQSLRAVIRKR